jgi:hypothetical protein
VATQCAGWGLAALDPRWAGGRPRQISDDDVAFIVATANTRPAKLGVSASESPQSSAPATSTAEGVQYLDDYAQRCEVGGSIQRTGPANINGTTYSHAISQTPNGYAGTAFYLARHAHRIQAIVGPTDDAAQGDRMQFELDTETGSTLFTSGVLGVGQTQPVDVNVEGVLRLFLVAKLAGQGVGAQGTAGWGDPRVAATELTCP